MPQTERPKSESLKEEAEWWATYRKFFLSKGADVAADYVERPRRFAMNSGPLVPRKILKKL
jgi:hypothetical protein